ncbi:hypothetical protein NDU88_006038 [Pleurodeles waltl]|uniref:Uncharacterized protein n=1 Tax=Pleurodeles waltl TaxID=8319 RepID=A0AAV7VPN9_PLEWA|nr:hypothetical protein NDU88_006038 [Pleurodeles waltl]
MRRQGGISLCGLHRPITCRRRGPGKRLPRTAPVIYGASSVRAPLLSAGRAPLTPVSVRNMLLGEERGTNASPPPLMLLPLTLTTVEEA